MSDFFTKWEARIHPPSPPAPGGPPSNPEDRGLASLARQLEAIHPPEETWHLADSLLESLLAAQPEEGPSLGELLDLPGVGQGLGRLVYAAPFLARYLAIHPETARRGGLRGLEVPTPVDVTAPDKDRLAGLLDIETCLPPGGLSFQTGPDGQNIPAGPNKTDPLAPLDDTGMMGLLRRWKYANYLRITLMDLLGTHSPVVTNALISRLSQAMIELAYRHAFVRLVEAHGLPGLDAPLDGSSLAAGAVVGMGKLGGGELNYSSDVDLIFIHEGDGADTSRLDPLPRVALGLADNPDGFWNAWEQLALQARNAMAGSGAFNHQGQTIRVERGILTSGEFHEKLGRRVTGLLASQTPDGFALRVDADLRPQGKSGLLSPNLAFVAHYYESQGREWERTALLKARRVAGSPRVFEGFRQIIRPFVYRRYLDYSAIEGLAIVKNDINRHHHGVLDANIKLGRGGIRENEFFVQAMQLLHGGRKPELQVTPHGLALARLVETGVLDPPTAQDHQAHYWRLRNLENRIQMVAETQTQVLPPDPLEQLRVLHDFLPDFSQRVNAALEQVESARRGNTARFADLFANLTPASTGDGGEKDREHPVSWADAAAGWMAAENLTAAVARMDAFFERLMKTREGERCVPKVERLLARPEIHRRGTRPAFDQWLLFLERIGNRNTLYALLEANPSVLGWAGEVFCEGGYVADMLIRHPEYLESFVSARPLEAESIREDFMEAALRSADEEEFILDMQGVKSQTLIRIFSAYLKEETPSVHRDLLTAMAEAAVDGCLAFAWSQLTERHGLPQGCGYPDAQQAGRTPALPPDSGFSVMALGKLGSRDMRFGSDLDLMFVYREEGTTRQGLSHFEFYTKLAKKLSSLLTSRTQFGSLYELDHRLRPFGSQGLLATPLASFQNFLQGQAEVWNFQAFTRMRPLAGDLPLGQEIIAMTGRSWRDKHPPQQELAQKIRHMLERLVQEHTPRHPDEGIPLKYGVGGMIGFEFLKQCVLLWGETRLTEGWGERPALTGGVQQGPVAKAHHLLTELTPAFQSLSALDERLSLYITPFVHVVSAGDLAALTAVRDRWSFEQITAAAKILREGVEAGFRLFETE